VPNLKDKEQSSGSLFETINSGARFSDCRKYRYALWRIWNNDLRPVMWIGLNPSKANESKNDNTISTVKALSENWGYGGFYMMNLFAIVSTDPGLLKTHPDPLGDNDGWIEKIAARCKDVVFAWGGFKETKERCQKIITQFPEALCIKILKDGSPKHPLYTPHSALPIKFNT
jgi:hypothetical protein